MYKKNFFIIAFIAFIVQIIMLLLTAIYIKNTVISSVVSTLIGCGLSFLFQKVYQTIRIGASQVSGFYRDEIFSPGNPSKIIKKDKFILKEYDGNIISGSFLRYLPEKNKLTNWKCSGFIVQDQLLLSYRAANDTTPSRGVILVRLDTKRSNGLLPCYKGKYFKFEGEEIISHNINLIKIEEVEYNLL